MSGAQTSLALQDKLTGPLMRMIKVMDSTIKVMENVSAATDGIDKALGNTNKNIANASTDFERLRSSMLSIGVGAEMAATQQDRLNDALNSITYSSSMAQATSGIEALSASSEQATSQQDRLSEALNSITPSSAMSNVASSIDAMKASSEQAAAQQNKLNDVLNSITPTAAMAKVASSIETVTERSTQAVTQQEKFNKVLNAMKPPSVLERIKKLFVSTGDETVKATNQQAKFNDMMNRLRPSSILQRIKNEMRDLGDNADKAAGQQKRFNDIVDGGLPGLKGLATGILAAVGAYKAFGAAKNFMTDIFTRGVDFHAFKQGAEVAFTTFLGDAEKAKKYMDDMYSFALKTPFAYPDLLESSRNLIAFGIQAENTFPIMQAIGDAVAGIGGGNAEMQNMADIFGQIQSQGRITAMEINRLNQYGVNAYEILGKAAGKSAGEMRKEISKGAVDSGTAIAALVAGMNQQFGGLMEGVKGTWRGTIDSLNSSMRNAGAALTEPFIEPLTKGIQQVTALIKKIPDYIGPAVAAFLPVVAMFNTAMEAGKFDGLFKAMGASITFVATSVANMAMAVMWFFGELSALADLVANHWGLVGPVIVTAGAALGTYLGILAVYKTLTFIIAGVEAARAFGLSIMAAASMLATGATLAQTAAQHGLNVALLAFPGTWILLAFVAVIALVIYAMVSWQEQTSSVIGAVVGSVYWLGAVFYNVLMGIGNFGIMVAEWFVNTWNQGIYNVQMLWLGLNIAARMVLDAIGNVALRVAEFFLNKWNDAVYGVQMAFYKMQQGILTVMSSVASGVTGTVNNALSGISTLINGAISGINTLIGLINNIPGVDIGKLGTVDLKVNTAAVDKLNSMKESLAKPSKAAEVNLGSFNTAGDYMSKMELPSAPQLASFDRLEYTSLGDAYKQGNIIGTNASLKASEKLTGAMDKLTGLIKKGDAAKPMNAGAHGTGFTPGLLEPDSLGGLGAAGKNPTGGKLDKIGKIDGEINIAEEDLKMLLEMADNKSITQVSNTLTPTVTIRDVSIREEADIDKLVSKINKVLEEDFNRSAKGVYT